MLYEYGRQGPHSYNSLQHQLFANWTGVTGDFSHDSYLLIQNWDPNMYLMFTCFIPLIPDFTIYQRNASSG